MAAQNSRRLYHSRADIPVEELIDKVRQSLQDENGLLIIGTVGVKDKDLSKGDTRADSYNLVLNPEICAASIFNQAIVFNQHDRMLRFCHQLREMANLAEHSIRGELRRQSGQN